MRPGRLITVIMMYMGLGVAGFFVSGCGDETKTTGTQLQLSEKDKAEIAGMRNAMKGRPVAEKQENAENRKKKQ